MSFSEIIEELPRLKAMLGVSRDRGAKVELSIAIPTGVVKLGLPGCYSIATAEIMRIEALRGMVAEAA